MSQDHKNTDLRQVFAEAADLIERQGWTQRQFVREFDDGCAHCLHGAVNMVSTGDPKNCNNAASALLVEAGYDTLWNDRQERRLSEVVSVLRRFAMERRWELR